MVQLGRKHTVNGELIHEMCLRGRNFVHINTLGTNPHISSIFIRLENKGVKRQVEEACFQIVCRKSEQKS